MGKADIRPAVMVITEVKEVTARRIQVIILKGDKEEDR